MAQLLWRRRMGWMAEKSVIESRRGIFYCLQSVQASSLIQPAYLTATVAITPGVKRLKRETDN
jgi:hypothetical protein